MAGNDERVEGGCFCGNVRFDAAPDYLFYKYCFCSRCRKVRGTIHAANIFVKANAFRWLSGEESIKRFDLEGARFGNCFCPECGSPVPRPVQMGETSAYLVPAGNFDSDPHVLPDDAIFWDSRADWMPVADSLEKKSEY